MNPKYESILHKPHHEPSARHPRMPREKRAAQFRPVTMTPPPSRDPEEIKEYWDWLGDQSQYWIEDGECYETT